MFWAIAGITLVLDQLTKAIVSRAFAHTETISVWPGVLRFTSVHNTGAAFGLFPGGRYVFIAASVAMVATIVIYVMVARPLSPWVRTGFALIVGGAVGNLIDRVVAGHVIDFIEASFIDFPVFNVADCGITVGTAIVAAWLVFAPQAPPDETRSGSADSVDAGESA